MYMCGGRRTSVRMQAWPRLNSERCVKRPNSVRTLRTVGRTYAPQPYVHGILHSENEGLCMAAVDGSTRNKWKCQLPEEHIFSTLGVLLWPCRKNKCRDKTR